MPNADMRVCPECSKRFLPKGSQVCCSKKCSASRWSGQLKALNDRRKAERRERQRPARPCDVCLQPFTGRTANAKYCCQACREIGLLRSVERQRMRRVSERSKT